MKSVVKKKRGRPKKEDAVDYVPPVIEDKPPIIPNTVIEVSSVNDITEVQDKKKIKCLHKKNGLGKGRYFLYSSVLDRPDMEVFYVEEPLPCLDPTYKGD